MILESCAVSLLLFSKDRAWGEDSKKARQECITQSMGKSGLLKHFHLPSIVVSSELKVLFGNKAAKEYLSDLSDETFLEFCGNLVSYNDNEKKSTFLSDIKRLFAGRSQLSNDPISYSKDYSLKKNSFHPTYSFRVRQSSEVKIQASVFEMEGVLSEEKCLVIVLNEFIDPKEPQQLLNKVERLEYVSNNMLGLIRKTVSDLVCNAKIHKKESNISTLSGTPPLLSPERQIHPIRIEEKASVEMHLGARLRIETNIFESLVQLQCGKFASVQETMELEGILQELAEIAKAELEPKGIFFQLFAESLPKCPPLASHELYFMDNQRFAQIALLAIDISSLHCISIRDKILLSIHVIDHKLSAEIRFPGNPSTNSELETFLRFALESLGKAMGIALFIPDTSNEEAKEDRIFWELNIAYTSNDSLSSPKGFCELSPRVPNNADTFAELVAKEQIAKRQPNLRMSSSSLRKSLFYQPPSLSKLSSSGQIPAFPTFGEGLSSGRTDKIDSFGDIPEELAIGDANFFHESINLPTKFLNDRKVRFPGGFDELFKRNSESTVGIIIEENRDLHSLIAASMRSLGILTVLEFQTVAAFFETGARSSIKSNCLTAVFCIDICQNSFSKIKSIKQRVLLQKEIPELEAINSLMLVGIRCGDCYCCIARKEELRKQTEVQALLTFPLSGGALRATLEKIFMS